MKTYNEQAWMDHCLDRIASEGGYLELLRECVGKMNAGHFAQGDNDWANVIVQKWNAGYDVFDAHCFLEIWGRIQSREIACIPIGPLPPPREDKDVSFNNGVVSSLMEPFSGEFFGGTGDDDGYIAWESPISAGPDFPNPIAPSVLPLEVGYTAGWTTVRHWFYEKGVARWPYGSERLYLLIRVTDPQYNLTPELLRIFRSE